MPELKVRKFPIQNMKEHPTILIFGPRRTGKSVLLRYLLYHINKIRKFHAGFLMGGSKDAREDLKDIFPASVNREFSLKEFKKISQDLAKKEDAIVSSNLNLLQVYDDCTYDKQFLKCKETREGTMNGRHLHVTDIKCMQYVMDMPPDVRTQMDYVFVTKQNRIDIMTKMWKFFFGVFPKFQQFQEVLKSCTSNYEVMVLDNTSTSDKIEDCIFYFKAEVNLPKFKLFDKSFWIMDKYYRSLVDRKNSKQTLESAGLLMSSSGDTSDTKKKRKTKARGGADGDAEEVQLGACAEASATLDPARSKQLESHVRTRLDYHLREEDMDVDLVDPDSEKTGAANHIKQNEMQELVTKSIRI